MAHTLPGLEGIDLQDPRIEDNMIMYEDSPYLKLIIIRALAIAFAESDASDEPWRLYLREAFDFRNKYVHFDYKTGGDFFLTSLFIALTILIDEKEPDSYGNLTEYLMERAPSEEMGMLLALPFNSIDQDEVFWRIYFQTIVASIDQRNNKKNVIAAAKSLFENIDGTDLEESINEYDLQDYIAMVSSTEGMIEAFRHAIQISIGEIFGSYLTQPKKTIGLMANMALRGDYDTIACFGDEVFNLIGENETNAVQYCEDWKLVAYHQLHYYSFTESDELRPIFLWANPLDILGNEKYDRILMTFQLGERTSQLKGSAPGLIRCQQGLSGYGRTQAADWTYARLAIESLTANGRAVLRVSDGALTNGADARVRQYFINKGWIEGVVSLPDDEKIKTSLLILSFGNSGVRFVDTRNVEIEGEELIDSVLKAYDETYDTLDEVQQTEGPEKTFLSNDSFDDNAILNSIHYLRSDLILQDPVSLEKLSTNIVRGTSMKASEIEKYLMPNSNWPSRYVGISDIEDGMIKRSAPAIKWVDELEKKHCAMNGDILISRCEPVSIAVVNDSEENEYLISGNLFILRLDQEVVNPYYVASFLSSHLGQEVIKRQMVGTQLQTLSRKNLGKVEIPILPMDEQDEIASAYKDRITKINMLKELTNRVRQQIIDAFSWEE